MTAAETFRAMLVERGAEWTSERVSGGVLFTFAKDGRTYSVFVRDRAGLEIWSQYLTPEQAIAATLGRGTCHMEQDFRRWDDDLGWLTSYTCSVCGESVILMSDRKPSCCPNCGARIEVE